MNKSEIKHISFLLSELQARRSSDSVNSVVLGKYKSVVSDYQTNERNYRQVIQNQESMLKYYQDNQPAKLDRFVYGLPVGIAITTLLFVLLR